MSSRPGLPQSQNRMIGLTLFVASVFGLFLATQAGSDVLRLLLLLKSVLVMASAIAVLQHRQPARQALSARRR